MIYIYCKNKTSPGISVIIRNLEKSLMVHHVECMVVDDVSSLPINAEIWPYGPRNAFELINTGRPLKVCFLVDYYSLGCKNKVSFYMKKGCLGYRDLYYSALSYFRYHKKEMAIVRAYDKVVLVSQNDIDALRKNSAEDKFVLLRNGVSLDRGVKRTKSEKIRMGIISHWTKVSIDETRWFVDGVFPSLVSRYPQIKLVIAGRGNQELARKYFGNHKNVDFIGEVADLDEFFSNLDIYVATVPKGCGILNKVLDAFSYKVFTIGDPASFTGFSGLRDGYVACETKDEYIAAIEKYLSRPEMVQNYIDNAYEYICEYHDWDKNYDEFVHKNVLKNDL